MVSEEMISQPLSNSAQSTKSTNTQNVSGTPVTYVMTLIKM
jgi:hypothetical protein